MCKCAPEQSYIIETVQSLPLKSVQILAEYFCFIAFVFVLLYFVFVSSSFTSLHWNSATTVLLKSVQISAEWPHRSASFGKRGNWLLATKTSLWRSGRWFCINWLSLIIPSTDYHPLMIIISSLLLLATETSLWRPGTCFSTTEVNPKKCAVSMDNVRTGDGGETFNPTVIFLSLTFGKRWSFNNDHCIILLAVGHHEHLVLVHFCFSALPSATL